MKFYYYSFIFLV